MTNLTDPVFHDDDAARAHLESIRWANGVYCPHCGNSDQAALKKLEGKSHRPGLWQCNACRQHFTVTVGSVMERSHIPLSKWVLGFHLMASSKKGISAHQLWRMLGFGSYRTAWFMAHRIREAMKEDVKSSGPIGGEGKIVEADETYIGRKDDQSPSPQRRGRPYLKRKPGNLKRTVVALVERGGSVRSFHVETATVESVKHILFTNASRKSVLYTDESKLYVKPGRDFAGHDTVTHSAGEYARGPVHTNTIENVFSVFKRGMLGTYQHCGEAHLHRYLAEFDFRYNRRSALGVEDRERADDLIRATAGKRLTYQQTGEAGHA